MWEQVRISQVQLHVSKTIALCVQGLTTARGKDLVNASKIGFHAFIRHLLNAWKLNLSCGSLLPPPVSKNKDAFSHEAHCEKGLSHADGTITKLSPMQVPGGQHAPLLIPLRNFPHHNQCCPLVTSLPIILP